MLVAGLLSKAFLLVAGLFCRTAPPTALTGASVAPRGKKKNKKKKRRDRATVDGRLVALGEHPHAVEPAIKKKQSKSELKPELQDQQAAR